MPDTPLLYVAFIVTLALAFDFLNGWNDAANSIATIVSTRVLSPRMAVAWAALFNFLAAFLFGVKIAKTIGKGLIDPAIVTNEVILTGLIGGMVWTYLATMAGMPISVSHALIGGFAGAAIARGGFDVLIAAKWYMVMAFIFISPIVGMVLGFVLMFLVTRIFHGFRPGVVNRYFRFFQLVSSAAFSLGHGANDAQKIMGIIYITLITNGYLSLESDMPLWVIVACYFVISMGTLIGGWRVIRTLGQRLTKLQPSGGFCAETAAATALWGTAILGIPVSTTHTVTGGIMGVGTTRRLSAVRWGVAKSIVYAWLLTIPFSAGVAAVLYKVLSSLMTDYQ